jgi:acetyl esterase/lipase
MLLLWLNKLRALYGAKGIQTTRLRIEKAGRLFDPPQQVAFYRTGADDLNWERALPVRPNPKAIIIYLHGGAYVAGSPESHRHLIGKIAEEAACTVVAPDYRLAPEHPFPAGLEDVLTTVDRVRMRYPASMLFLAGDSAGAGLALATAQKLIGSDIPLAGLILLSPWVDLEFKSKTYKKINLKDPVLSKNWLLKSAEMYIGKDKADNPLISPILADFTGFPPVFIQCGTHDLLFEENELLVERMRNQGVEVKWHPYKGMPHVFQFFWPELKEAGRALRILGDWVKHRVAVFLEKGK